MFLMAYLTAWKQPLCLEVALGQFSQNSYYIEKSGRRFIANINGLDREKTPFALAVDPILRETRTPTKSCKTPLRQNTRIKARNCKSST